MESHILLCTQKLHVRPLRRHTSPGSGLRHRTLAKRIYKMYIANTTQGDCLSLRQHIKSCCCRRQGSRTIHRWCASNCGGALPHCSPAHAAQRQMRRSDNLGRNAKKLLTPTTAPMLIPPRRRRPQDVHVHAASAEGLCALPAESSISFSTASMSRSSDSDNFVAPSTPTPFAKLTNSPANNRISNRQAPVRSDQCAVWPMALQCIGIRVHCRSLMCARHRSG